MPENTVEILIRVRDDATKALAQIQRQSEEAATGLARANLEMAKDQEALVRVGGRVADVTDRQSLSLREATRSVKFTAVALLSEYSPALANAAVASDRLVGMTANMAGGMAKVGVGVLGVAAVIMGTYLRSVDLAAKETAALATAVRRFDAEGLRSQLQGVSADLDVTAERFKTVGGWTINIIRWWSDLIGVTTNLEAHQGKLREAYEKVAPAIHAQQMAAGRAGLERLRMESAELDASRSRSLEELLSNQARVREAFARETQAIREQFRREQSIAITRAGEVSPEEFDRVKKLYELKERVLKQDIENRGKTLGLALQQEALDKRLQPVTAAQEQAQAEARRLGLVQQEWSLVRQQVGTWAEARRLQELRLRDYDAETNQLREALDLEKQIAAEQAKSQKPGTEGAVERLFAIRAGQLEIQRGTGRQNILAEGRTDDLARIRAEGEIERAIIAGRTIAITQEAQAAAHLLVINSELAQIARENMGASAMEKLSLGTHAANAELERQRILFEELVRTDPMAGLRVGLDESIEHLTSWGDTARSIVYDTAGAMGRYTQDLFLGRFKDGLKEMENFAMRTWSRIASDLATSAILQQVRRMLGGAGPPLGFNPAAAAGLTSEGSALSLARVFGAGGPAPGGAGVLGQFTNPFSGGTFPAEAGPPQFSDTAIGGAGGLAKLLGSGALAQGLGGVLGILGGGLGLLGAFQQHSARGLLTGGLSGLGLGLGVSALGGAIAASGALGAAAQAAAAGITLGVDVTAAGAAGALGILSPWVLGPIGAAIGLGVGLAGMLSSTFASRSRNIGRDAEIMAQRWLDALPEFSDEQLEEALRYFETGVDPTTINLRPLIIAEFDKGRFIDFRPGGDVDRRVNPQIRQDLIRAVQEEQANRERSDQTSGFLIQEAFAPNITRYEALAGSGKRQRDQAIAAVRRGALVELINAAGADEIETLLAKMRSVAELRAIPILPQRRYVEVLG